MDELRSALELTTDDELQALTEILFRPKFNPLDYLLQPSTGLEAEVLTRQDWLDRVEQRFRFLAADGVTVLSCRSHLVTYRQVLMQICSYLKLPCSPTWPTADIEAEVFLHLVDQVWSRLSPRQQQRLQRELRQSLAQSPQFQALPLPLQTNPMGLLLKGSGVVAVNAVLRPWLLGHIARQIALHAARQQMAKQALARAGSFTIAHLNSRLALGAASRGMAVNLARYSATRTVFAFLGPALWAWLLADVGWRAVATNYGRVIPVVFTLAQIRLTRSLDACDRPDLAPC